MKSQASLRMCFVLIMAMAMAPRAMADESERDHRRDHDDARRALLDGKTKPLTAILAIVEKRVKGPVIDVDLETRGARLVYVVQVLSKDGRKVDVELDARSGEVLRSRNR